MTELSPQNSNSSARAIRKTALRAYCGCHRCFAHILALSSSDCQEPDSYASINPSPDNQMAELSQKILKNEKKYLHLVNLYDIVIFAVRDNRTADMNKAPWSSGQDASLSRWNQGFDSPRSHLKSPFLRAFFVSEKQKCIKWCIKHTFGY